MTKAITPTQTLLSGFVFLTAIGTILLLLPVAAAEGRTVTFIDALFMSASAVTTTGLITVDTGSHLSFFGHNVLLMLIQVSGLGYMIFIVLLALGVGGRFTIGERLLFSESIAKPTSFHIRKFIKSIIVFTALFELFGALGLGFYFAQRMPLGEAAFSAVFHSVSAFCTAGFSLYTDNLTAYADHFMVNAIVSIVAVAGGIGFFVLYDAANLIRGILRHNHPLKLSDHTKLVFVMTALLMVTGGIMLFLFEGSRQSTGEGIITAFFQAISASSTTGFNTVDIGAMSMTSLLVITGLMFIGASPGSTGGGIKTTSFGIILLFILSVLTNRPGVSAFRRTIAMSTVARALGIGCMAALFLSVASLVLVATEGPQLMQVVFEAVSAFTNTGLSTGITPSLSVSGKLVIIVIMLIGRVGPLAIGYTLLGRIEPKRYSYPTGDVMVG